MRFLILFIFLLLNSLPLEASDIKNLIVYNKTKKYDSLSFLDSKNNKLKLERYKGNLILLNFWATWCAPSKKEI